MKVCICGVCVTVCHLLGFVLQFPLIRFRGSLFLNGDPQTWMTEAWIVDIQPVNQTLLRPLSSIDNL